MKEKPERTAPAVINTSRPRVAFRKVNMAAWPQGLKSLRLFFTRHSYVNFNFLQE